MEKENNLKQTFLTLTADQIASFIAPYLIAVNVGKDEYIRGVLEGERSLISRLMFYLREHNSSLSDEAVLKAWRLLRANKNKEKQGDEHGA